MSLLDRPQADRPSQYRYVIYLLLFVMSLTNYADRSVLSVAMPELCQEFSLSTEQAGWVLSSFLWSYSLLNFPSALLVDRVGPRWVGACSAALWSVAMVMGGVMRSIPQFLLSRVILGAGESPTFSLGSRAVKDWAPPSERGFALTLSMSGIQGGLAAGAVLGSWLIGRWGWRMAFFVLGLAGLAWAGIWLLLYRQPGVATPPVRRKGSSLAVLHVVTKPVFWAVAIPQCVANYATFLMLSWLPLYLIDTFHITAAQSGNYFSLCYFVSVFISIGLGRLFYFLGRLRDFGHGGRRYLVALSLAGAMVIWLVPFIDNLSLCLAIVSFGMAMIVVSYGESVALIGDLTPVHDLTGSVCGVIITVSSALGATAPVATGYLVAANSGFQAAFSVAALFLLAGAIVSCLPIRQFLVSATD
ncbi:MFS transporter [Acetobacter sp. TBRC 12305]|uniref:MFS transporter n=1 Tax=Acetobacter garciniae TaxID=2817435 RepID=A0A939HQA0_9PROT|nr:MFS transporter [Acetobacter garciniae]MBO1326103.1 MFS transporter [Acetobacter garciniae]MBX0345152.1 MFS transporter [Acetobacter garciniae]